MEASAGAHPWRTSLKARDVAGRRRLRDLLAQGWAAERRSNTEYPRHRQYRVRAPDAPPVVVDLHAGTCSCRGRGGSGLRAPGEPCVHEWFVRQLVQRHFVIGTVEWADPEPRASWQEKMGTFHAGLRATQAQREAEERLALERERLLRAQRARAREAHFHSSLPDGRKRKRGSDAPAAAAADTKRPKRTPPHEELAAWVEANTARWQALGGYRTVIWEDVPWWDATQFALLQQHHARVDRAQLKLLRVLWHPDRFAQHFSGKVDPRHYDDMLQRVTDTSQRINGLLQNLIS